MGEHIMNLPQETQEMQEEFIKQTEAQYNEYLSRMKRLEQEYFTNMRKYTPPEVKIITDYTLRPYEG